MKKHDALPVSCPHCRTTVRLAGPASGTQRYAEPTDYTFTDGADGAVLVTRFGSCPQCARLVVRGGPGRYRAGNPALTLEWTDGPIWPRNSPAPAVDPTVPGSIKRDFEEAHAVREISSRAGAALARRCLQAILRDKGFKAKTLEQEINLALPQLPGYLATPIHDVRRIGNFAAHEKLDDTGAVVDVEPAEAEHLLGILDDLFDHFYAKPAKQAARAAALNAKDPTTNPAKKP